MIFLSRPSLAKVWGLPLTVGMERTKPSANLAGNVPRSVPEIFQQRPNPSIVPPSRPRLGRCILLLNLGAHREGKG